VQELLGQQAPRVVIVRALGDDAFAGRLVAELSSLGFDVAQVEAESSAAASLVDLARQQSGVALIRVREGSDIELWIRNPNTGQTAFTELVSASSGREPDEVVVRAVEVLRARLLRVGVTPETRPSEPERKRESKTPAAPVQTRDPRVFLQLAPSAAFSPGGLGINPLLLGGVRIEAAREFALFAFGALPLQSDELASAEGSADVSLTLLGASATLHLVRPPWMLAAGPGLAAAIFDMRGSAANAGFQGRELSIVTALIFGELALSYRVSRLLRLKSELRCGVSLPRATIRFAGRDVGNWGRPFGMAGIAIELGLPGL
jgi:hypothetical protein